MIRNFNFLGDMRLDVPHLRMMESAVTADFGVLGGEMVAGGKPVIVRGFSIAMANAIGGSPDALSVVVAGGSVLHPTAAEAGSILTVPANRAPEVLNAANTKVVGSFVPGTNYVGLDLCRATDPATADLVTFVSATTGAQFVQNVPLARMLDYKFYVQTANFEASQNLLPIAIVEVDANGAVSAITDARPMFGRLGRGGTSANALTPFWSMTNRTENPIRAASLSDPDPFVGGDKYIGSLREWMGFTETRLWEIGGGEHWYSATDRDCKLVRDPTKIFGNGDNAEWDAGTGNIHWKGLSVCFQGSTGWYNVITDQEGNVPGQTDLAQGECLYVDLDRTQNATVIAHKASMSALGSPTVPGARYVFAWRPMNQTGNVVIFLRDAALKVGVLTPTATTSAIGGVLLYTDPAVGDPVVPIVDATGLVIATGMTRPGPASGTLYLGQGAYDTNVALGSITGDVRFETASQQGIVKTGGHLTIGTNDNHSLILHANGVTCLTMSSATTPVLSSTGQFELSGAYPIELNLAGDQEIIKTGSGALTINGGVGGLTLHAASGIISASTGRIAFLSNPVDAQDADTLSARNTAIANSVALGTWAAITPATGWTAAGCAYNKQPGSGLVFLRGSVTASAGHVWGDEIGTLPVGYRPATTGRYAVVLNNGGTTDTTISLGIGTNGVITLLTSCSTNEIVSLDGIVFFSG